MAILEKQIWEAAKPNLKHGQNNRYGYWMKSQFGGNVGKYEDRHQMVNRGEFVEPLWSRIMNENLPVKTALRLSREAKNLAAAGGMSNSKALEEILEDYDNLDGAHIVVVNGKSYKRPHPKTKASVDPRQYEPDVSSGKTFKAHLRKLLASYTQNRLGELEENLRKELADDFEYQIRVLCTDFFIEIDKKRRQIQVDDEIQRTISWRKYRMACEALGLFPRNRIPVDFQEARKKFKSLATQFHPDRNDGSEDMRKQYQAAVEAWEIVKDYMEQLKRNGSKKK